MKCRTPLAENEAIVFVRNTAFAGLRAWFGAPENLRKEEHFRVVSMPGRLPILTLNRDGVDYDFAVLAHGSGLPEAVDQGVAAVVCGYTVRLFGRQVPKEYGGCD